MKNTDRETAETDAEDRRYHGSVQLIRKKKVLKLEEVNEDP